MLPLPPPLDGTHFNRNRPGSGLGCSPRVDHACRMLTEIYIEALLVDEELADQVWELWNAGKMTDELAAWAWLLSVSGSDFGNHENQG